MPPDTAAFRIALTTAGSIEEASRIARHLVELRLAACVNLVPNLTSVYRWQGTIEEAGEVLLVIKTSAEKLHALEAAVLELHSYELPEFVTLNIESASQPYLTWLLESVDKE